MQQRLYFSSLLFLMGCLSSIDYPRLEAPPSFEQEVFPLIRRTCALPACHGQSQRPYFSDYTSIQKKASRIEKRITHERRPMPPTDGKVSLSAKEQQLILDWIAAGAPDN